MTKEELMKPRIKVLAIFPLIEHVLGKKVDKGDILTLDVGKHGNWILPTNKSFDARDLLEYPDCFEQLFWWQHRAYRNLPDRIKDTMSGEVINVDEYKNHRRSNEFRYAKVLGEEYTVCDLRKLIYEPV